MQLPLQIEFRKQSAIQDQVVQHLQRMIVTGVLPPGSKVPSTRALSEQLTVSRGSVVIAYERLAAEGHLEPQSTTATYVSRNPPEMFIQSASRDPSKAFSEGNSTNVGAIVSPVQPPQLFDPEQDKLLCDFRFGRAEKSFFPIKAWRRLIPECLGGA